MPRTPKTTATGNPPGRRRRSSGISEGLPVSQTHLAWRYDRIQYLMQTGKAPESGDDASTRRMYKYLNAYSKLQTELAGTRAEFVRFDHRVRDLCEDYPTEANVFALRNAEPTLRFGVEAYLLTELSLEEIQAMTCLSPETLQLYMDIYYNIMPIQGNILLLTSWLFGSALAGTFVVSDIDRYWKAVALFGGAEMLRTQITYGKLSPKEESQLSEWIRGHGLRSTVRAVATEPVNTYNSSNIMLRHNDGQRVDMERTRMERDLGAKTDRDITDYLAGVLGAMRISLMSSTGQIAGRNEVPEMRSLLKVLQIPAEYVKPVSASGNHRKQLAGDVK
jgi:hypothetical protein